MLISHDSSETRVALLENRELVELYEERNPSVAHACVAEVTLRLLPVETSLMAIDTDRIRDLDES